MRNLYNIEKSTFHRGEYVGYHDGPWRIVKRSGIWRALHKDGRYWSVEGRTLADVSKGLEKAQRATEG